MISLAEMEITSKISFISETFYPLLLYNKVENITSHSASLPLPNVGTFISLNPKGLGWGSYQIFA